MTSLTSFSMDGCTLTRTDSGSDTGSVTTTTTLDSFGRTLSVVSQPGTAAVKGLFCQYDGFGNKVYEISL